MQLQLLRKLSSSRNQFFLRLCRRTKFHWRSKQQLCCAFGCHMYFYIEISKFHQRASAQSRPETDNFIDSQLQKNEERTMLIKSQSNFRLILRPNHTFKHLWLNQSFAVSLLFRWCTFGHCYVKGCYPIEWGKVFPD